MYDETRVRELLESALTTDRTPEEICVEEPDLLPEVRRRWRRCCLVEAELKSFFPQTIEHQPTVDARPPSIEGYEIESVLGFGGMGVVYKARQFALGRTVAIKVLRAGDFASDLQRARFLREAESIAGLSNPAIVQIYDYGHCQGQPYYAMEYVDGQSLAEKLVSGPLPATDAARYARDLAEAIGQAHALGIVHRDLKPANLLLTQAGKLKVADFGLARQLDDGSHITLTGDALGTPSYMAPEQALGAHNRASPAVDIYAIGAVLYEMLTGHPPFQAETAAETQRQLLERDPVPPSRLNAAIPRELQTVCMTCLEKPPERRYASAEALADDLRRVLSGEPIAARPIGAIEQTYRWAKRNRTLASTLGTVVVSVVVLLIASIIAASHFRRLALENGELARQKSKLATETENQRNKAEEGKKREQQLRQHSDLLADELLKTVYLTEMNLTSESASKPGGMARLFERLARWDLERLEVRDWEWGYLNGLLHQSEAVLPAHAQGVQQLRLSPSGNQLLTVGGDHRACIWDIKRSNLVRRFAGHSGPVQSGTWNPTGERVATADRNGVVCVWNAESGELIRRWTASKSSLDAVAWSPDGKWIATGGVDRVVRIWNAESGEQELEKLGHQEKIAGIAWCSDSRHLASCAAEKNILVWNLETPADHTTLEGHQSRVTDVEWSPSGEQLASTSVDRSAIIWNISTNSVAVRLDGRSFGLKAIAWSPDGLQLATGGDDQLTRIWSAADGTLQRTLLGHSREVNSVDWGEVIATGGGDGEVRIWNASDSSEFLHRAPHNVPLRCVRWSPVDSKSFVAAGGGGQLLFCSGNELKASFANSVTINSIAWKPTGEMLATLGQDGAIHIWDAVSRTVTHSIAGQEPLTRSIDWSAKDNFIAAGCSDGTVNIWTPGENKPIKTLKLPTGLVMSVAWSPDGSHLSVSSSSGYIKLYEVEGWSEVRQLRDLPTAATMVAWSPDGSTLAVGAHQDAIEIWRISDGERVAVLHGNRSHPANITWNRSGRRIASAGRDGSVRVWDVESSREVIVISKSEHSSQGVSWSCDGFALASCGLNGEVLVYDAWRGFFAAKSSHLLPKLNASLASAPTGEDLRSRGLVYSRVHDHAQASHDLQAYLTQAAKSWIIADCYVAGPFSISFEQVGPPESPNVWSSSPPLPPQEITWTRVPLLEHGFVNLGRLFDGKGSVSGYVYLPIYCVEDRDVSLRLGSDDQMRVWVNQHLIHESRTARTAIPGQDQVRARFHKGWNQILVRVANERNNHILYLELDDVSVSSDAIPSGG